MGKGEIPDKSLQFDITGTTYASSDFDIKTKCRNWDLLFLLKNQFFRCNSFDIDNHRLLNITTNGCWTGGSCYATIFLYGP